MTTDFRVVIANRPGALVRLLGAVAAEGVNVTSFCGDIRSGEKWGYLHLLVEDPDSARKALEKAGVEITSEHHVDVFRVEDRPGSLAEATKRYAEEERNIEVLYMTADSRIVIGTEDMQQERFGVRMGDAKY